MKCIFIETCNTDTVVVKILLSWICELRVERKTYNNFVTHNMPFILKPKSNPTNLSVGD